MTNIASVLFMVLLALHGMGCQPPQPTSALPTTQIKLGNQTFTLEIANDFNTRAFGLMKRDSMPDGHGMIFVFAREQVLPFHMKNTRIPLDIVFVDANGRIVTIKQMKPYDLNVTSSDRPAKWAIELNKGAADAAGVKVGDQLEIPPAAKEVKD